MNESGKVSFRVGSILGHARRGSILCRMFIAKEEGASIGSGGSDGVSWGSHDSTVKDGRSSPGGGRGISNTSLKALHALRSVYGLDSRIFLFTAPVGAWVPMNGIKAKRNSQKIR